MKLLLSELRAQLPPLYATEHDKDPIVQCKFFTPWSHWTWLITGYDGEDTLFGWVYGDVAEWGYSSLSELETVRGPFGLQVERDLYFKPCRMSLAQEQLYQLLGRI
jgi:Protein of unknown function (DUF2958)